MTTKVCAMRIWCAAMPLVQAVGPSQPFLARGSVSTANSALAREAMGDVRKSGPSTQLAPIASRKKHRPAAALATWQAGGGG
jgi:hypothetical protein